MPPVPRGGEGLTSASRLSDEGHQALRDLVGLKLTIGEREVRIARHAKIPADLFKSRYGDEDLNPVPPVLAGGDAMAASFSYPPPLPSCRPGCGPTHSTSPSRPLAALTYS